MAPLQILIGNYREAPPVMSQPQVQIFAWRIFETQQEQLLAGFLDNGHTCRLTSPIETVNFAAREVRTCSGRIYELLGPPATEQVRLAVIAARLRLTVPDGATDITDTVWAAMCAATA